MVVGDQQQGRVRAEDRLEQPQHAVSGLRVQGAGGLVGDQQLRPPRRGQGQADPLPLASGELVGQPAQQGLGVLQAQPLQQGRPIPHLGAGLPVRGSPGQGALQVGADAQVGMQGAAGILRDPGDRGRTAALRQGHPQHVPPLQAHPALGEEACGEGAQHRGGGEALARPGGPQQGDPLPPLDPQVHRPTSTGPGAEGRRGRCRAAARRVRARMLSRGGMVSSGVVGSRPSHPSLIEIASQLHSGGAVCAPPATPSPRPPTPRV